MVAKYDAIELLVMLLRTKTGIPWSSVTLVFPRFSI